MHLLYIVRTRNSFAESWRVPCDIMTSIIIITNIGFAACVLLDIRHWIEICRFFLPIDAVLILPFLAMFIPYRIYDFFCIHGIFINIAENRLYMKRGFQIQVYNTYETSVKCSVEQVELDVIGPRKKHKRIKVELYGDIVYRKKFINILREACCAVDCANCTEKCGIETDEFEIDVKKLQRHQYCRVKDELERQVDDLTREWCRIGNKIKKNPEYEDLYRQKEQAIDDLYKILYEVTEYCEGTTDIKPDFLKNTDQPSAALDLKTDEKAAVP